MRCHPHEIRAFTELARYPATVDTKAMGEAEEEVDSLVGQPLFGSYVIQRRIGQGGMGAVYAVESVELGKTLAMKVLLGEAAKLSTTTAARFVAEARAASAINHRNIIDILDSAELPDGRRYILMEYLDGPTLREFSKKMGPLTIDVALAVLAQVCSGLQAAHDRGIIHRDLKPSNIIIAPQPDNPYFTKIVDFGIAKLSDPALGAEFETQTSAQAGTPAYMAPEQARALKDVDHRTDIYALGVMAYRLFCGQLPYQAHSIGELVHQQATTQPEPLARRRGDLPSGWTELVHSAMALDRADRPQSANEFAQRMIAATPQGESIARSAASMLFATQTPSYSQQQAIIAPIPTPWSQVSMPDGTMLPPPGATAATAATAPTVDGKGRTALVQRSRRPLLIWFLALALVSGAATFLVMRRDTSDASDAIVPGEPEEQPTAVKPTIEPVEFTPALVGIVPDAGAVDAAAVVESDAPSAARKGRRNHKGAGKNHTNSGDQSDKKPKTNEEDLFHLRK